MTFTPTDAFHAFAVGREDDSPMVQMTQALGTRMTDHRGLIDLPALAVLFDDLGGYPFWVADQSATTMQARLSMSMLDRPDVTERLTAVADLRLHNKLYGSTTVDITGDADDFCASAMPATCAFSGSWSSRATASLTCPHP